MKLKVGKLKICSGALVFSMILQLCFFCPCTYAAHNRLMEVLGESENLSVEDIKPLVESNPYQVKEIYNGKNKKRKTVLYYALCKGENTPENRSAIAMHLIEKGAGTGPMWKDGDTPLHWAAAYGQDAFVQFLLEKGSDPNKVNGVGKTPLDIAKENNHESTVKLLESHGAGKAAAEPDVAVTVPAVVPACDVTAKGTIDDLCKAAETGDLDKVCSLLESGINPNTCGKDDKAPLHLAAFNGHEACVKLLLEKGADPNFTILGDPSVGDIMPLHLAAFNGHGACVKLLLEKGANPNFCDERTGCTPLHLAAKEGNEACVRLLLEKGADPNHAISIGPDEGMTPFLYAIDEDHEACVRLFLEKGADPNYAIPDVGTMPLIIASRGSNKTPYEPLKRSYEACVKLLLEKGADPNQGSEDGLMPLHWAVLNNDEACVRLLLEKGANPDCKLIHDCIPIRASETPLYMAAKSGLDACVKLLLENGAEPNQGDKDGKTPLDVCCTSSSCDKTHKNEIEALLKAYGGKKCSAL